MRRAPGSAARGPLVAFMVKEVQHILRDRQTLTILILMPLLQVVLFGYALRTDIQDIRVAVVDPTPDYATLTLRNRLGATDRFRLVQVLPDASRLETLFRRNEADVGVEVAPRFGTRLARGEPADIQIVADASDPNGGTTMAAYVNAVIDDFAGQMGASGGAVHIALDTRMRFNPTLASVNLFVPGLIALVITLVSALMTAISLSREKERGTLESLLVSPLRPWQIIVGKVAPYLAIGFVSVIAVLIEARLVFQVPVRGSVALLLAEGLLYILVSLSLGILVSARTSSQRVAMMATIVGTMLPTIMLSGFVFPIESMPVVLRWITPAVPARWFVSIVRGIMLVGVGLDYLWPDTLVLAGMAAILLVLSIRSFHARLE